VAAVGHVPLHFTPLSERRFMVTEGSVKRTCRHAHRVAELGDFAVVPKAVRIRSTWSRRRARDDLRGRDRRRRRLEDHLGSSRSGQ